LSVHTSFQFTQGSASLLDGFFLGGAVQVTERLHVTAGIGLRKGKELSPGFREAAARVIAERVTAGDPAYQRFSDYRADQRDESILDGLPLNTPGKETPFFPGEPVVDSYNWSFFAGVSVPVAVTKLFETGKGNQGQSQQAPASNAATLRAQP
jgi:hypothetical protein